MLRRCLVIVTVLAGLAVAGCGFGPSEPMPPDDNMLVANNLRIVCALVDSGGP